MYPWIPQYTAISIHQYTTHTYVYLYQIYIQTFRVCIHVMNVCLCAWKIVNIIANVDTSITTNIAAVVQLQGVSIERRGNPNCFDLSDPSLNAVNVFFFTWSDFIPWLSQCLHSRDILVAFQPWLRFSSHPNKTPIRTGYSLTNTPCNEEKYTSAAWRRHPTRHSVSWLPWVHWLDGFVCTKITCSYQIMQVFALHFLHFTYSMRRFRAHSLTSMCRISFAYRLVHNSPYWYSKVGSVRAAITLLFDWWLF